MNAETGSRAGGTGTGQNDGIDWPDFHPARLCDGRNPMTGRPCRLGEHAGYHQDVTGAEWLDD
jgi:hypothetical protein